MRDLINKYRDQISGTLSGFDRLVFRGTLRRLNYEGTKSWAPGCPDGRGGWSNISGKARFCSRTTSSM